MNEYTLLSPENFDGKKRGDCFTLTPIEVNDWISRGAKLWAKATTLPQEDQSAGQLELLNNYM
jgi:hypothetical protein